jgi:hypothetical protein
MTELDQYTGQQPGIVTLQHRYRELGRLRAGEQRESRNGKRYPAKLDTFRFTSTDWRLIQRAADIYGGQPSRWEDAPTWNKEKQTGRRQYQVTVEQDRILVSVPAQQQLTQSMEYWTAGGCQRRCNGVAMISGEPCECRNEMAAGSTQLCDHYTRANFVLPNLPGLGVWRLESHGVFAASELPLQIAMAAQYGPDVEWWLRLDPRDYRTTEGDGKPVTYHFHVPVLDTDRTPAELFALRAGAQLLQLDQMSDPGVASAPPGSPGSDPTSSESAARAVGQIADSGGDQSPEPNPAPTAVAGSGGPRPSPSTSPEDEGPKAGRGRRGAASAGKDGATDAPAGPDQATLDQPEPPGWD